MPTGKRASMREGPLADLFRKTEEETTREPAPGRSGESAAAGADRPIAGGSPERPSAGMSPERPRADAPPERPSTAPAASATPGTPAGRPVSSPRPDTGPTGRRLVPASRPNAGPMTGDTSPSTASPRPGRLQPAARPSPGAPAERDRHPERDRDQSLAQPAAGRGGEPAPRRAPTPQERLRTVFSADIPERLPDRAPPRTPELAPPSSPAVAPPTAAAPVPVSKPILRVVGVGGAGVNAVNRMIEAEIAGVEFVAINTDVQSLQQSAADVTLHIGEHLTRGLGSGADPEVGEASARGEYDRIKALLRGSDMVFIAAGAGGGTGTGAAPVVAQIAREVGALTVGIVTRPFAFEGSRRRDQAERGIAELAPEVDTLIVVPNNRLLTVLDRKTSMVEAFRVADDVLRQGVQGIADLVTLPGLINLDFADVRTVMAGAGSALLGIGMGTGDRRAIDAAEQAVASPLLETSMEGARSILLSITGSSDLSLWEVNEAAKAVAQAAHPDANIIFGAMVDENLEDNVWVTVVATGYGDGRPARREPESSWSTHRETESPWGSRREAESSWGSRREAESSRGRPRPFEGRTPARESGSDRWGSRGRTQRPAVDFDVPEFMPPR